MRVLLTVALLFCATLADAVVRSDDARGQVLLFPIVTTHSGFDGLISISNADDSRLVAARLVLRPLEGEPVRVNAYLSPGGTFAAAVAGGQLITDDAVCAADATGPIAGRQVDLPDPFLGTLEVFEMASLDLATPLVSGIVEGTIACENWIEFAADLRPMFWQPPRGLLAGTVHLVDQSDGLSFSIAATVLDDFSAVELHFTADDPRPDFDDVNPPVSVHPGPDGPTTLNWTTDPAQAVAAALAESRLETDFSIEASIAARSEIVLAFPLLRLRPEEADDGDDGILLFPRNREGRYLPPVPGQSKREPKCSPAAPQSAPFSDSALITVRVDDAGVFRLPEAFPAIYDLPYDSRLCGYGTREVSEFFDVGTFMIELEGSVGPSDEGQLIEGAPVVAASVTAAFNTAFGDRGAGYALVNEVRRLSPGSLVDVREPLLCRGLEFGTGFTLTTDGTELVLLEADGVRSIDIDSADVRFQAGIFPGGRLSLDGQAVVYPETGNLVWRDIAGEMETRIALADESVEVLFSPSDDGRQIVAFLDEVSGNGLRAVVADFDSQTLIGLPDTISFPTLDREGETAFVPRDDVIIELNLTTGDSREIAIRSDSAELGEVANLLANAEIIAISTVRDLGRARSRQLLALRRADDSIRSVTPGAGFSNVGDHTDVVALRGDEPLALTARQFSPRKLDLYDLETGRLRPLGFLDSAGHRMWRSEVVGAADASRLALFSGDEICVFDY